MTQFTPLLSLLGGALIGLSATMVLAIHGKVAGVSGIYGALFQRNIADRPYRVAFMLGLAVGGLVLLALRPSAFVATPASGGVVVLAGLLVGYGTRVGGGCTSGHGVCGLSRLSKRSLVATLSFMGAGFATVLVVRHTGLLPSLGGHP